MLVGPSGGGKSAIEECLAGALTELGTKHIIWRMNPKAITAPQMFGRMDASTGDWTDGIFAVLWRRAAKNKNQNTWIVLDGPVDAIWIENLNTVLDDNKVLTLANGDRILMTPAMKAMFEPENLANASPATVSRAGIIYVSDTELGWEPVVKSWLQRRDNAEAQLMQPLFDKYVNRILDFVRINLHPVMFNEQVRWAGGASVVLGRVGRRNVWLGVAGGSWAVPTCTESPCSKPRAPTLLPAPCCHHLVSTGVPGQHAADAAQRLPEVPEGRRQGGGRGQDGARVPVLPNLGPGRPAGHEGAARV